MDASEPAAREGAPPGSREPTTTRRAGREVPVGPAALERAAGDLSPSVYTVPKLDHGRPWIWSTGVGLVAIVSMLAGIVFITFKEGLALLWPAPIVELRMKDGTVLLGEVRDSADQKIPGRGDKVARRLIRVGNREKTGVRDFVWINDEDVVSESRPRDAWSVERIEYGNLYAFVDSVNGARDFNDARRLGDDVRERLDAVRREMSVTTDRAALAALEKRRLELEKEARQAKVTWRFVDAEKSEVPASTIVRAWQPNQLGFFGKCGVYISRLWEFLTSTPRESNTEGGIFPVIMGTLFVVIVMTVAAVPLGVVAAVYLNEYARPGKFLRLVRLAIANLAGVPSIVFGIFGLGLFVYFLGGAIDHSLYPGKGSPTFGSGGILWGALTLALLTVPVVIVAAGEGLQSVPRAYRDGALALGATRWQTTWNVVIPQAMPGILTGMILAIGRGAGEVAPLMVLGAAVKLAPQPIVDGAFPFFHLERKFLHLGFHIYDVSMQSPNVEAAKPMTYASTAVLMLLILALNLTAILVRARLRRRFQGAAL